MLDLSLFLPYINIYKKQKNPDRNWQEVKRKMKIPTVYSPIYDTLKKTPKEERGQLIADVAQRNNQLAKKVFIGGTIGGAAGCALGIATGFPQMGCMIGGEVGAQAGAGLVAIQDSFQHRPVNGLDINRRATKIAAGYGALATAILTPLAILKVTDKNIIKAKEYALKIVKETTLDMMRNPLFVTKEKVNTAKAAQKFFMTPNNVIKGAVIGATLALPLFISVGGTMLSKSLSHKIGNLFPEGSLLRTTFQSGVNQALIEKENSV